MPGALSARLPRARDPGVALVDVLGTRAPSPAGKGQVDAGVHEHFERYGPFRESWAIAEEWPLTSAAYRYHHQRFLYERRLTARTSSRRMELQPFGYLRTFLKWVSVVFFPWARISLTDRIRHQAGDR